MPAQTHSLNLFLFDSVDETAAPVYPSLDFADLQILSKKQAESRGKKRSNRYSASCTKMYIYSIFSFRVYPHVTKLYFAALNISCLKEKHILQKLSEN